jgi:hypothetical protein
LLAAACPKRSGGEPEGSTTAPDESTEVAETEPVAGQLPEIQAGGSRFVVVVEGDTLTCSNEDIAFWVRRSAEDVAAYFGRFPVPDLRITVAARRGGSIGFGQHWDGRRLKLRVGPEASRRSFERDWVLVHEMLHAGFPDLDRRHKWMQEGLSTYLERLVQARAGHWSVDQVWARWLSSMEIGRPRPGDRGYDNTRTWASLYWGGALYWFMADYEIRKATNNEKSLRDALVGILDAGGNGRVKWTTQRVIEEGDRATGTTVLRDLYARLASAPGDVDLDEVFAKLGVSEGPDGEVVHDDTAEHAHIRRAMTEAGK